MIKDGWISSKMSVLPADINILTHSLEVVGVEYQYYRMALICPSYWITRSLHNQHLVYHLNRKHEHFGVPEVAFCLRY